MHSLLRESSQLVQFSWNFFGLCLGSTALPIFRILCTLKGSGTPFCRSEPTESHAWCMFTSFFFAHFEILGPVHVLHSLQFYAESKFTVKSGPSRNTTQTGTDPAKIECLFAVWAVFRESGPHLTVNLDPG